jgi:hypothetical protein
MQPQTRPVAEGGGGPLGNKIEIMPPLIIW